MNSKSRSWTKEQNDELTPSSDRIGLIKKKLDNSYLSDDPASSPLREGMVSWNLAEELLSYDDVTPFAVEYED